MTRLPPRLQPFWPLVKRVHRFVSLTAGILGRRTRRWQGDRALPARGTASIDETRDREPQHVTIHRAAEGELIRRSPAQGSPAGHWVFDQHRIVDIPAASCLDIEHGTVVGDFGAVITPGGTLDGETSDYFGVAGWREHPLFLRPRLPVVEEVDGTVAVLATRGGNNNYYHFLLDVLPRFGVLEQTLPAVDVDAIFVPNGSGWQRTLLGLAGLGDVPVLSSGPDRAVRARRLLVPSVANRREAAPSSSVTWLRDHLPPQATDDTPRRIFVTRGQVPNSRRVVHEDAVMEQLAQRGFVSIDPATLTPQGQIDLFAGAEVVVAAHGAALTNLLFLSPGARVLEMFAPNYVNSCYWAITQGIAGVRYRYLVGDGWEQHGPGDPMNKILADIEIPAATIVEAVDQLLAD